MLRKLFCGSNISQSSLGRVCDHVHCDSRVVRLGAAVPLFLQSSKKCKRQKNIIPESEIFPVYYIELRTDTSVKVDHEVRNKVGWAFTYYIAVCENFALRNLPSG
jgi:hypothetical protein